MNDYNKSNDLKDTMMALLRAELGARPVDEAPVKAPKAAVPAKKKENEHLIFKVQKAAEFARAEISTETVQQIADFLNRNGFVQNARITLCPEGSSFLRTEHGEQVVNGDDGVYAVLRTNHNGQMHINIYSPSVRFAEQEKMERERTMARLTTKVKSAMERCGLEVDSENIQSIVNFIMTSEKMIAAVNIFFLSEGHPRLRPREGEEYTRFDGENGMYAILTKNRYDAPILQICLPQFNNQLRMREYPDDKLSKALADWVILTKHLQVRGDTVNKNLEPQKVIDSDRTYLNNVLKNMLESDAVKAIVNAVATHPEYLNIRTYAFTRGRYQNGACEMVPRIYINAIDFAKDMASNFEGETCTDLIQGKLEKMSAYNETLAVFDTTRSACYLSKVTKWNPETQENEPTGFYFLNIYIPNTEMQKFLEVVPSENKPEESTEASSAEAPASTEE